MSTSTPQKLQSNKAIPANELQGGELEKAYEILPDFPDVSYGPHPRNVFDLWKAKNNDHAPLLIWIHGGGFINGTKMNVKQIGIQRYIESGFAVASIQYRLTDAAPFPAQMHDAMRALQFIRYHAQKYGIDPKRIACAGGSAGSGISQWLGFHKDLADPKSKDPIAQQSTRISAIGAMNMQCTYDPRIIKQIIPGRAYQIIAMKRLFGVGDKYDWDAQPYSPEMDQLINECGPLSHLKADAPPVFICHIQKNNTDGNIHHSNFGVHLEKHLKELKIPHIRHMDTDFEGTGRTVHDALHEFLKKHL